MDVGILKATVVVSDLRGKALGRASQPFADAEISAEERIAVIDRTAMMALHSVGASPEAVLAVCAGIAAPVDRNGEVLATQHFWGLFDVGLKSALHGPPRLDGTAGKRRQPGRTRRPLARRRRRRGRRCGDPRQ